MLRFLVCLIVSLYSNLEISYSILSIKNDKKSEKWGVKKQYNANNKNKIKTICKKKTSLAFQNNDHEQVTPRQT